MGRATERLNRRTTRRIASAGFGRRRRKEATGKDRSRSVDLRRSQSQRRRAASEPYYTGGVVISIYGHLGRLGHRCCIGPIAPSAQRIIEWCPRCPRCPRNLPCAIVSAVFRGHPLFGASRFILTRRAFPDNLQLSLALTETVELMLSADHLRQSWCRSYTALTAVSIRSCRTCRFIIRCLRILSGQQHLVWQALSGQAMSAQDLADTNVHLTEGSVRHHVGEIRRSGRKITWRRGRGYFRPGAPPTS